MLEESTDIVHTTREQLPRMSWTTEVPTNCWTKQSAIESDSEDEAGVGSTCKCVIYLPVCQIVASEDR